jgi:outer membrane receptor protein involved in Fe transport
MKKFIRYVALAVIVAALGLHAGAQVNTGTITGVVQDETGALVVGAKVEIRNAETGLVRLEQTEGNGAYTSEFLPVGTYTVTASHAGFRTVQRQQITLVAAQQLKLDFQLPPEGLQQNVVVSSEAPLIDAVSSQDNSTVAAQQVNQLPIARNNWTNLLTQTTGAVKQTSSSNSTQNLGVSLNGLPTAGFNLTVDGTNAAADPEVPTFGFYQAPNIINTLAHDSIQEVSIIKGIAPATVGGAMSGGINMITKSGTNHFHGTLFELNEVSALDARNYFATTKPRVTFNQFGGGIGGPIFRDKLFFFGAYEGARLSQFRVISGSVPTPYIRAIAPAIYATQLSRLPTAPQPSTDAAACSAAHPDPNPSNPNKCATNATYQGTGANVQNDSSTVARIDHNINDRNSWYARYTRNRPYLNQPALNPINPQVTTAHGDVYNIGYLHQFRNLSSNSRFGYNRLRLDRAQLGFYSDQEGVSFGFNTVNAEVFRKAGRVVTGDQQFAMTLGKHSLQFGATIQRNDAGRTDQNTASFTYTTLQQFLANQPSKATINFDVTAFNLYQWQYGGYIQDDYRITPTLTLNLGLRYDYFTVVKEASGRVFNRGNDPVLGNGFGPYRPADQMYDADFHTGVQPRLGFAWSPRGDQTVVRGGFGILTGRRPFFGGPIEVSPTSATAPANLNLTQAQIQTAKLAFPIPRSSFSTVLAQLQASGAVGTSFAGTSIDPHQNNPYSIQWTLAIQQAFPGRIVLDLGYVGNHGLNENYTYIANLPSRTTGVSPNPLFGTFNRYISGDASNYHAMQAKLRKQMQYGLTFGANYTWAKSLSYGDANLLIDTSPQDLNNLRAEYGPTQYDIRNNFSSNVLWEIPFQNWFRTSNRAVNLLDRGWRTTMVINANTGLPVNITNGSSTFNADRPNRLTTNPYLKGYQAAGATGVAHQYLLPSPTSSNPNKVPIGFAPPTGTCNGVSAQYCGGIQALPGNLTRNAIRNIGQYTIDLSAAKSFVFTEALRIEFRVDAFNLLNHTNFSGLGTNINSSTFGFFTSATPRTIQLGGRFNF